MTVYRPVYHVTPKQGWINDPNGFVWFKGHYHLYCQHNPHDIKWGPMHWLHYVSEDLIHFEEVGIALKPDHPYDQEYGCFSGSSIEIDGKLYVLYTGCSNGKQTQCLAISEDGHVFEKYKGNPVLDEKDLPEGYLVADFRDPKIIKQGNLYYVLTVSRHKEGYCSILLYSTVDLVHYSFIGVVKSFHNLLEDGMVECPDVLFEGGRCALIYSLQHPKRSDRFQNEFLVAYTVGRLNLETGRFEEEGDEQVLDCGSVCYATQTLQKDGKNYLVYWQSSWDIETIPTASEGYAGQLSLIKEAHIDGALIKLNFLPGSNQKSIQVNVISEQASLRTRNLEIQISKSNKTVTVSAQGMEQGKNNSPFGPRTFHLDNVDSIHIDYVYDNSCIELRFQNGEAFASILDFNERSLKGQAIQAIGCTVTNL